MPDATGLAALGNQHGSGGTGRRQAYQAGKNTRGPNMNSLGRECLHMSGGCCIQKWVARSPLRWAPTEACRESQKFAVLRLCQVSAVPNH